MGLLTKQKNKLPLGVLQIKEHIRTLIAQRSFGINLKLAVRLLTNLLLKFLLKVKWRRYLMVRSQFNMNFILNYRALAFNLQLLYINFFVLFDKHSFNTALISINFVSLSLCMSHSNGQQALLMDHVPLINWTMWIAHNLTPMIKLWSISCSSTQNNLTNSLMASTGVMNKYCTHQSHMIK